jgi:hypothetical protein
MKNSDLEKMESNTDNYLCEKKKFNQEIEKLFEDLDKWRLSFYYIDHPSLLFSQRRTAEDEDFILASKYCPRLYVDPKLFAKERGVLARNLGVDGIALSGLTGLREVFRFRDFNTTADSIFHLFPLQLYIYNFDKKLRAILTKESSRQDVTGANLWLLCRFKQILERVKSERYWLESNRHDNRWRPMDTLRLNLLKGMETFCDDISDSFVRNCIQTLFMEIFPNKSSPTCIIKFNVLHHPKDPNLLCIQYFFYWPIQIWPHHIFDYEPVYVYLYKIGENVDPQLLAVAYNSVGNKWATRKVILSLFRKYPGHLIRIFFNYDFEKKNEDFLDQPWGTNPLVFAHDEFNHLASFMTKAYGGKYVYEELPEDKEKSHIKRLLDKDGRIALCIPKTMGTPIYWHSFDLCSSDVLSQEEWRLNTDLFPLNCHDLLHIEWNINSPFRAPFLYPVVGGTNPRMHAPFDFRDLMVHECHGPDILVGAWQDFCDHEWDFPGDERTAIYRLGRLIELLYTEQHRGKQKEDPDFTNTLWRKIKEGYVYNVLDLPAPEWYYSYYDSHHLK